MIICYNVYFKNKNWQLLGRMAYECIKELFPSSAECLTLASSTFALIHGVHVLNTVTLKSQSYPLVFWFFSFLCFYSLKKQRSHSLKKFITYMRIHELTVQPIYYRKFQLSQNSYHPSKFSFHLFHTYFNVPSFPDLSSFFLRWSRLHAQNYRSETASFMEVIYSASLYRYFGTSYP